MKRRILFIGHSASRNGASVLLLDFMRWLKANTEHELDLVCLGDGPLLRDFRAVARTRVLGHPWLSTQLVRLLLLAGRHDLVYANTVAVWRQVRGLDVPVLWHVHELPYAMEVLLGPAASAELFGAVERFVAVSRPVARALSSRYAVDPARIDVVNGFCAAGTGGATTRAAMRASLGWPADGFVVGACGTLDWRKGTDLFLQIARRCANAADGSRMRFLWVGGSATGTEALRFRHDVEALGLQRVVRHVPSNDAARDWLAAMDVLALTSREDPYPLVMLEAAAEGVPTVCFAGSGGGPEFVDGDAGLVVPYLDVDRFAEALARLAADPSLRESTGRAAAFKARRFHSLERQAPLLLDCIERSLAPALALSPGRP